MMKYTPVRGHIVLVALVFFAIFLTIATALINYVVQYQISQRHAIGSTQALALAEAGVDKAIYELNVNAGYAGEANTPIGEGEFSVSVTSIDSSTKRITATGYIPNSTDPKETRTVTVNASVDSSVVSFRYGVQVGIGGVVLDNGSQINGNLYSNGDVDGSGSGGSAYVTGDVTVAGGTQAIPNQEWTTQDGTIALGDVSARANLAQSFVPSTSGALNKVSFNVRKVGTPSDMSIRIVTDNAGKPSKTVLASGSMLASSVGSSMAFSDATLASPPNLNAGQTYWIIAIASVNATNHFVFGTDTSDGYVAGTGKSSPNWNASSPAWTALGDDLGFKAWMGGVVTTLDGVRVGGDVWANAIVNCDIGGDAMYQTNSNCTVDGSSEVVGSFAAPASMPISDAQISDWEDIATAGGVISGNYTVTGTQTLGPKKIDGDLTVSGTLILSGPIWVSGDVTFGNNTGLSVHSSTGNNGAVIIADKPGSESTKGRVTMSNNMTIAGNGNAGSYPMVLSTNTGSSAINMSNNSNSVILYAPYGTVTVSNNAQANQITAHTLHLSNNAIVNYINGLQNQGFSNGPGGSWTVIPGTYSIGR